MRLGSQFIYGTKIEGKGSTLGVIDDLLFDEATWATRYLVVNSSRWLPGRKFLVPPLEIVETDWLDHRVRIQRDRHEIEASPRLEEHEPVSRQLESDLADYFDWPRMWGTTDALGTETPMGVGAEVAQAASQSTDRALAAEAEGDPHLRSSKHVLGYGSMASDGEFGAVEDVIVEDVGWRVLGLVIALDSSTLLTRPRFLVESGSVESFDWEQRLVRLKMTRGELEKQPEFNPDEPVNRVLEERFYDYYGRPRQGA